MKLRKGLTILWQRLTKQGLRTTAWWAADHLVRIVSGAPIRRVSEVIPGLHLGGQYRRYGWPRLQARGITAVVNLRVEWDDLALGIAPERYLHLPTVDDAAPSLAHLVQGSDFIAEELERGGAVYVHCGSGIGRAATLVAAYLVAAGRSPEGAWDEIRRVRPFVRPSAAQIEQLEVFARECEGGISSQI
jgi:hypothetical protein